MKYEVLTASDKLLSDYLGIDMLQVADLDFDQYRALYRDAYIYKLMQSSEGREYLEEAWLLKQTKPDRKELRRHFQKEGG